MDGAGHVDDHAFADPRQKAEEERGFAIRKSANNIHHKKRENCEMSNQLIAIPLDEKEARPYDSTINVPPEVLGLKEKRL